MQVIVQTVKFKKNIVSLDNFRKRKINMESKFRGRARLNRENKVPIKKYWGAQTQRSLKNFKIGNDLMPIEIVYSFALQKAAAISNIALKKLEINLGEKIIETCDEIYLENMTIISRYPFGKLVLEHKLI